MTEKYKRHSAKEYQKEAEHRRDYEKAAGLKAAELSGLIPVRTNQNQNISKNEEDQFWDLYDYLNVEYHYLRYACSAFYITGFLLFSWVIIKNILWVLAN